MIQLPLLELALAGVLWLGDAQQASPSFTPPPSFTPSERQVLATLRESRADRSYESTPYADAIEAHAPRSVELMLDVLRRNRIPAAEEGEAEQILSQPQRAILLEALGKLPAERLVSTAQALTEAEEAGPVDRALAITLRSLTGQSAQVAAIAGLAIVDATPDQPPSLRVLRTFEDGLERLLSADDHAFAKLGDLRREQYAPLYPSIISAIGDVGSPVGCQTLSWIVARAPETASQAFAQLAKTGPSHDDSVNATLLGQIRQFIDGAPQTQQRAGLRALAALGRPDGVPLLLPFLESEGGLAADALGALHEITGVRFAGDALRWRRWYEDETQWHEREYPNVLVDLHCRRPGKVVEAVRELARHPLHRDVYAEELSRALEEAPDPRKPMICAALQMLGSERALPALARSLGSSDQQAKLAAHRVLRAMTSLDLPADQKIWKRELSALHPELSLW